MPDLPPDATTDEVEHERISRVLRMRKLGMSPDDIATRVGMGVGEVAQVIIKGLRQAYVADIQSERVLTQARYDLLFSAWLPRALGLAAPGEEAPDMDQQAKAADITLRLLAGYRQVSGIDPPKVAVVRQTTVDLETALAELAAEQALAARPNLPPLAG